MAERRKKYAQLMCRDSRKGPVPKTLAVQDVSLVTGTLSVLKVRKSETPMTSNRDSPDRKVVKRECTCDGRIHSKKSEVKSSFHPGAALGGWRSSCTAKVTTSGVPEFPDFKLFEQLFEQRKSGFSRPNSGSPLRPSQFGS